jgi:hypothetical protein
VCWIDADVLRWRKFGRRRQRRNRHRGRNVYNHSLCECYRGFDHANPHHETHTGRAIAALAGLI